ncbi:general stress protein [Bacillus cereus group sp. Bc252]|uniref:general stress protein n=1 Tax=Bacillus cereus group TaxID=86661 RepID=UPI0021D0A788|nr:MULTISPECIES: general stress protein [Bacillus cereus group]MCU5209002.1 general stress protein [Bacillus paranthracis]MDA2163172.1 general stress protein [Bacillus cereus group sp. Bc252]HDR7789615.1 general stress protein [Bacillus paranthracis]
MNMDRKIVGVFPTIDDAALVINELKEKGYSADNISAIAKDQKEIEHLEEKSGEKVNHETAHKGDIFSATGLVAGGLGGLLTGLGVLAVSGLGPIVAAGPIAAAIGGAGIGGGAGSLIGAFIGLGIPEEHAKKYEEYIYDGNILILVDAKLDDKLEIYKIFDKHNAYNSDFFK